MSKQAGTASSTDVVASGPGDEKLCFEVPIYRFDGDSLIEPISAAVVLWRFRFAWGEARAARIAGGFLFALAGSVVLTSVLNFFGYHEAQCSLVGIGILLAAAVVMPRLASRKRKLAVVTSSAALKADAAESSLCGYMAWTALAGLAVNAVWGQVVGRPCGCLGSHSAYSSRGLAGPSCISIGLSVSEGGVPSNC